MTLYITVIILVLLITLFMGAPVSSAMGFTALVAMLLFMNTSHVIQFATVSFRQVTNMNQMVAPLFILMAEFLARGGVATDIFDMLSKALRKFKGGLAIATTLACTIFAALCGSSPATAASIGRISIGQMIKHRYRPSFAVGTVAAGGTLGIMIPPSITFVTYGIITENSIAKLLMAGLLPGLMLSLLLCVSIAIRVRINPKLILEGSETPETAKEEDDIVVSPENKKELTKKKNPALVAIPAGALILIVLGSLYTGFATPSEAAGFGAIGACIIVACMRRINKKMLSEAFSASAKTSCMILFLVIMGLTLSYVISYLGIAQKLATAVVGAGISPWSVMIMLYLLWFVLGCLMDPGSMIILTIPFIYPTLIAMGFDPIWIGVVAVLCVEIGMITPPVGLNLFILRSVSNVQMGQIIKGALPYVIVLIIGLAIVSVFPQIALFLPSHM